MWQRRGNKPPTIGPPTQFTQLDQDTSYDEGYEERYDDRYDDRYLETIHEVDSISSRRQSTHMALPELPFRNVPPMTDIPQPVNLHTKSSLNAPTSREHGLRINVHLQGQRPTKDEVSPLTPQELRRMLSRSEQPVSPIEKAAPSVSRAPLPERAFQSQIPRKKVRRPEASTNNETKWDEYSGEPTTDERGKPASVRPGTTPVEMQFPQLKERTKLILAGLRERDAANRTPGIKPPPIQAQAVIVDLLDEPPQRAPWRGASGRAAIVEPVKNTPAARNGPLPVPDRVIEPTNVQPLLIHTAVTTSPSIDSRPRSPSPVYQELPQFSQPPSYGQHEILHPTQYAGPGVDSFNSPQLRSISSEESIKPTAPLKTGRRIRTPELVTKTVTQSPEAQNSPTTPEPVLPPYGAAREVQNFRVESPQYAEEPTTPTTPVVVQSAGVIDKSNTPPTYAPPDLDREQSRFSWTTYTTSVGESPRSMAQVVRGVSPPPPVPELAPAISIKKRHVSSSPFMHSSPYSHRSYADSSASVVRKPLPTGVRSSSVNTATTRAMSTSKSLPPTPTILEASDKIENLDAQIESLERRKHNITRIIMALEASLKKNAVVYDMWKRREVEKNITNHKLELDEVSSEIHEISLRLHRAQRKRDRDDNYEACTGLWIKRVTS